MEKMRDAFSRGNTAGEVLITNSGEHVCDQNSATDERRRFTTVHPVEYGPTGQVGVCPYCLSSIKTEMKTYSTIKTHFFAALLCLFCCWCCSCVPYCMGSCKAKNHYCPSCSAYLGKYNE